MKESYLYKKLKVKKHAPHRDEVSGAGVQCRNCAHFCIIEPGDRGKCGVRKNIDGKLYSLNYGKAIAVNIDPIEKKPFFHFLPGSYTLSIAAVGCNFSCKNCQNFDISQGFKAAKEIPGEEISPEQIVDLTLNNNLSSISYTYTEPTVFLEYALDIMKLARKKGIKNIWVTNGFLSKEALEMIAPYLDATNVDLKSFDDKFYQENCDGRLQPVLDTLKRMKTLRLRSGQEKIWVEITTLVIPTLSDDLKMFKQVAEFIKKELGAETPWHITQFCGAISWKLQHLPDTPVKTLKNGYRIGKKAGLKYVYTGNVLGLDLESTFCPKCNSLAIKRIGYSISRYDKNGNCPKCGEKLDLIM